MPTRKIREIDKKLYKCFCLSLADARMEERTETSIHRHVINNIIINTNNVQRRRK